MFNVINNSSSKSIEENLKMLERGYSLRSLEDGQVKVPIKGKKSCQGFSYIGPKLWNYLPKEIRTTTKIDPFKSKLKEWIWSHIPSIQNISHIIDYHCCLSDLKFAHYCCVSQSKIQIQIQKYKIVVIASTWFTLIREPRTRC